MTHPPSFYAQLEMLCVTVLNKGRKTLIRLHPSFLTLFITSDTTWNDFLSFMQILLNSRSREKLFICSPFWWLSEWDSFVVVQWKVGNLQFFLLWQTAGFNQPVWLRLLKYSSTYVLIKTCKKCEQFGRTNKTCPICLTRQDKKRIQEFRSGCQEVQF